MRAYPLLRSSMALVVMLACRDNRAGGPTTPVEPSLAKGGPSSSGPVLIQLPSLGSNSEAWGVDAAGTTIVGHSYDRAGALFPVKWTMQNGAWTISILPNAPNTLAKAVNGAGDAAGYNNTAQGSHAVLWPAGGSAVTLGCGETGPVQVWGISAAGQVVVGNQAGAAVWTPGSCRENLPALAGGWAGAQAVNANGSIIGGTSAPNATPDANVPVRWTGSPGARQVEALDTRVGGVQGANAAGDLAGYVTVPCALADGCRHAMVWYAAGGVNELSALTPLGENSVATSVNSAGEVAGYLTTDTRSTAYFWSAQLGAVQLPSKSRSADARALSDVRADGTRLVVGNVSVSGIRGAVWVIRNR